MEPTLSASLLVVPAVFLLLTEGLSRPRHALPAVQEARGAAAVVLGMHYQSHQDGDISLANTYRTRDGQACFGAWGHMSTFVQLVHVSTLITMEEEFEDWAAPLVQMLRSVQTKPLNAGMTFYFPGWLAVGEDGKVWEVRDG